MFEENFEIIMKLTLKKDVKLLSKYLLPIFFKNIVD